MLYFVMSGLEIVAICSRAADAHALSGYDYGTQKSYQVVAKQVDRA
jgi:hypothetical protein